MIKQLIQIKYKTNTNLIQIMLNMKQSMMICLFVSLTCWNKNVSKELSIVQFKN